MGSSRADNHSDEGAAIAGGDERVSRTVIKPRAGFRAELPGLDIATLLQMTCARRNRVVVRVTSEVRSREPDQAPVVEEGFIYSANGRIVHATLGSAVGEEAVLGMMSWVGGEFSIVDRPFPERPTIDASTDELLLLAAQRADERERVSAAPPPLPAATTAQRTSAPPPVRHGLPPVSPRISLPPVGPLTGARARPEARTQRESFTPPPPRDSFAPPPQRDSFAPPPQRDSFAPTTRNATVPGPHPSPRPSLPDALYQSYDEPGDDAPTLFPPAPTRAGAGRANDSRLGPQAELPRPSTRSPVQEGRPSLPPRRSVPPPPPPAAQARASTVPNESLQHDSALIASVRVDSQGAVVGTFAGEGTGDLLPQLVAYVTRLITLLRADFSLDPFEALHAELSGMRIVLFEDAGETVGLMMRPGSAVQELRQRLGV